MTEEVPEMDPEKYKFPDKYFEKMREYDGVHEGLYSVWQGGLYQAMADPNEALFSQKDAMDVTRLLNRKEIDEAEEFVYSVLEGE